MQKLACTKRKPSKEPNQTNKGIFFGSKRKKSIMVRILANKEVG